MPLPPYSGSALLNRLRQEQDDRDRNIREVASHRLFEKTVGNIYTCNYCHWENRNHRFSNTVCENEFCIYHITPEHAAW